MPKESSHEPSSSAGRYRLYPGDRRSCWRHPARRFLTLLRMVFCSIPLMCGAPAFCAEMVVGGEMVYTVQEGDNLLIIGAKHGVFWRHIAEENNLDHRIPLAAGARVKVNTRRIVPRLLENGIIVNIPDRTLYFFKNGKTLFFPVGVGSPGTAASGSWHTPTGRFRITGKRKNPTWYVPPSIRMENMMKGMEAEEEIPPGPTNPLGSHALQTSIPALLIHSTISPGSVYRYTSHGCLRMLPEHMAAFYPMVSTGTEGEIIYEPVKLATTDKGGIYLEVRSDVYKQRGPIRDEVSRIIKANGLSAKVDWAKIGRLIRTESGVAEDVSLPTDATADKPSAPSEAGKRGFVLWRLLGFFKLLSGTG